MIILQPHICPRCRVSQNEWRVPSSAMKKKRIRPGDPWPILEAIHTEAVDQCKSCGYIYKGIIKTEIDEHGNPVKMLCVKEIEI